MAYLFRQQFNINELIAPATIVPSVVIVEPDVYLAKLAEVHLANAGFLVHHCHNYLLLGKFLHELSPSVLLVNPESYDNLPKAITTISSINRNFPRLIIVTIAHNLEAESLKGLMIAGIAGHINRKLSRPRDVGDIIKTLIV